jgi:hypothetical protein
MNLKTIQSNAAEFRRTLLIDADGQHVRLGETIDVWQAEDFAALDPVWRRVAGHEVQPTRLRDGVLETSPP